MARRRKYKPIHESSRSPGLVWWILVLACLIWGGIYWWQREPDLSTLAFWRQSKLPVSSAVRAPSSLPAQREERAAFARSPGREDASPSTVASFWEYPMQAHEVSIRGELILAPAMGDAFSERPPADDFELQLALVRNGCSPGSIDGLFGPQTRAALLAFQEKSGLPATGHLDITTRSRLLLENPPTTAYTVTEEDLSRLRPVSPSWLGKSQQERLEYETVLEFVAEKGMAYPSFIRQLNPTVDWEAFPVGTSVTIPFAYHPPMTRRAAFVKIFLNERILQVFDIRTNLLAHFPCSIGSLAEKRPVGRLEVAVIAENPNYTFNPAIFSESPEARSLGRKLIIPPGPNNPVGLAWIGLDRPGYGIHGTPIPEKVGRTESHGCFRLSNWNAAYLLKMSWLKMPVYIEP